MWPIKNSWKSCCFQRRGASESQGNGWGREGGGGSCPAHLKLAKPGPFLLGLVFVGPPLICWIYLKLTTWSFLAYLWLLPKPSFISILFFSRKTTSWRRWLVSGRRQWFKLRCAPRATSDVPSRGSTWRNGTPGGNAFSHFSWNFSLVSVYDINYVDCRLMYSDLVLIWKAYAPLEAWTSCWRRSKPWAVATTRTWWSTTPASSSGMNCGWCSGCSRWEDCFKWNNSS